MKKQVIQYIKRHKMLEVGDRVLVSVSGGPDSICLLHIFKSLEISYKLKLMVVHINHLLRGKKADEDENYVKNICKDWSIPYIAYRVNIKEVSSKKGISIEEAGREIRYKIFRELKQKHDFHKIALGQHGDDNAETIIMRIIRGTGPNGLAGIPPIREDGIIRPLLSCSKVDIEKYCQKHNLSPRIDHTNLEPIYFRNKIRLEVIPYLEKMNANLRINLQNLAEMNKEQQDYIQEQMEKLCGENFQEKEDTIIFSIQWFNTLSIFEKKEILRRAIEKIKSNLKEIHYNHIELILHKMDDIESTTWTLHLPRGIRVERQYHNLFIKANETKGLITFQYPLIIGERTFIPEINKEFKVYLEKNKEIDIIKDNHNKIYFDYNKIGQELWVRNRRTGDRFQPLGGNGTKKLKDYFIDLKLPKENRDTVPIVVNKEGILWVVGYRPDKKYVVDETTKEVLIIECIHKEENNEKRCKRGTN